ncbi:GntR family transcriptional regulator [Lapidilactobacillus mulanensis]|uniref:GntR family transcriptional regulator n=1 Tax=Lapidilactobacillus mulanensis TaxID=2485999 RepID=A0ABW4DQL8_9LACO|nr:substrate-binding domain-containing protein [Lapidilactobacillus mulanensis]
MAASTNKYLQIFADLRDQIWAGKYVAGQQLPSENELAKTYRVSRITSKRALQELADTGLVERRQGSGTFMRPGFQIHHHTKQILLVIPFAMEAGLGDYIAGIKSVLTTNDQDLIVIENNHFTLEAPEKLRTQYDGVIFYPQDLATELTTINQLLLAHFPTVLIDQTATGLPVPSVVADNTQGGRLATTTLIDSGHQRIAFLSQTGLTLTLNSSVAQRYFGYLQALSEHDLSGATDPQLAYSLTKDHFKNLLDYVTTQKISAIVCENDILAIQLLDHLQKINVAVPEQLSLIGFDNISKTAISQPQLTTIAQDFHEIGRQAALLLEQRIENPYEPKIAQITVPVELMSRLSIQTMNTEGAK